MEAYRMCGECGVCFYSFDSPPADKCFCGGSLRYLTEEELLQVQTNINKIDVNYATCSC